MWWFESWQRMGIFLFTIVFKPVLGPTQPPIQWKRGALSLGIKQLGREANHSPPSSVEVKKAWSYISIPPVCLHGMVLSYSTETTLPFKQGERLRGEQGISC